MPFPASKAYEERQADETETSAGSWKEEVIRAFRSTRVVTPDGLKPATIVVKSGRIVKVTDWEDVPGSAQLTDYANLVLLPGLVDTHVHINDAEPEEAVSQTQPSRREWEGFRTATQAAAAGGVTTLVDMPLNCVPETISVRALEQKRQAAANSLVDWMSWGGIVGNNGIGGNESELAALIEAGVPGFKCFLVHSGIDGFPWVDEAQLHKSMAVLHDLQYRGLDLPLLAHAELPGPIEEATKQLNTPEHVADWRAYSTYLESRPDEAECKAIELLIGLATIFDLPVHIVHLSTARAFTTIKQARAAGLKLTVETCPHYLWFSSEEIPDGATEFKCAPPIRSSANRESLWEALLDGTIDLIATDHSPCPPVMKAKNTGQFDLAWGGIASLGLALPVVWTGLHHHSAQTDALRLESIVRWLSTGPARLAGLSGLKGALGPGYDADIVVFDPDATWTVTPEDLHFRHKSSPYLGAQLQGRILKTYLRGDCVYRSRSQEGEGEVVQNEVDIETPPRGHELRRTNAAPVMAQRETEAAW